VSHCFLDQHAEAQLFGARSTKPLIDVSCDLFEGWTHPRAVDHIETIKTTTHRVDRQLAGECAEDLFANTLSEERWYSIANQNPTFWTAADELKGIGEGLKSSTLTQRQWSILMWVYEFSWSCARYGFGRFLSTETAQTGRCSAPALCCHTISHSTVGSALVTAVLQALGEVPHCLTRTK